MTRRETELGVSLIIDGHAETDRVDRFAQIDYQSKFFNSE